jgi:hypothetical protein
LNKDTCGEVKFRRDSALLPPAATRPCSAILSAASFSPITELAGTVHEMTGVLRAQHDLRPRVERCERDIADIRRRMP